MPSLCMEKVLDEHGLCSTESMCVGNMETVYGCLYDDNQTLPSLEIMSPSQTDDSGIYVTYNEETGKLDENNEDLAIDITSLSPIVLLMNGATPVAVVAREDTPETPIGAKRPPRYVCDITPEPTHNKCVIPLLTADEGFEFYQREIIEYKLGREMLYFPKDFLSNQPEVTPETRACVLNWMTAMTRRCKLKQDTLFLGANIVDRFLSATALSTDCIQLLGIVSLFIAGKQEEQNPLDLLQLLQLSRESFPGEKYSCKQALLLEKLVLGSLKFDLHPPTSLFFMETLATHRITSCRHDPTMLECIEARRRLARYFLEAMLLDYSMCHYRPSLIAAGALTGSEEVLQDGYLLFRPGPHSVVDVEFMSCLQEIREIIDNILRKESNMDNIMNTYSTKY